jgi:hypothetical protein
MSVLIVNALVALAAAIPRPSQQPHALSIEDRVRAADAIARVYHAYQIGSNEPFELAVSRRALEQQVRMYLKQSVALERFWNTPITAGALQGELRRMATASRLPGRLREIYRALGNDPFLIEECLARPALADRLARSRFESERQVRGDRPGPTWESWWPTVEHELDETAVAAVSDGSQDLPEPALVPACGESWDPAAFHDTPLGRRGHTAVWTGSNMIVWGGAPNGGNAFNTGARYDPALDLFTAITPRQAARDTPPSGRARK